MTGFAYRQIEAAVAESERAVRERLESLEQRLLQDSTKRVEELERAYDAELARLSGELASYREEVESLRTKVASAIVTPGPSGPTATVLPEGWRCTRRGCGGTLRPKDVEGVRQLECSNFPACKVTLVADQ